MHHIPELNMRKGTEDKMSKSEDYLDQLLRGINQSEEEDTEAELLDDSLLEEDLLGEDALDAAFGDDDLSEEFLKEFELEMAGLDDDILETDFDDDMFESLLGEETEDVAETTGEAYEESDTTEEVYEESEATELSVEELFADAPAEEYTETSDIDMAELLGTTEDTGYESQSDEESVQELFDALGSIMGGTEEMASEEEATGEADFSVEDFSYEDIGTDIGSSEESPAIPEEDDAEAQVAKILEGLDGIDLELDDFGGAGTEQTEESKASDDALLSFLAQTEDEGALLTVSETPETEAASEEPSDDKKNKKKEKDGEQKGFLGKLGTILFGEDEDEEEEKEKTTKTPVTPSEQTGEAPEARIEEFSVGGEYDDLFKDFTTTSSAPVETKTEEPEDKKKGKKKKEKVKKEKVKKEKKPKPKKEKKPKKPKEPDNTPPLPKKPVFLIFLMVASFVALILIGTDLVGYNNSLNNAKNAFAKKNYTEAYSYVSAVEMKEKDLPLYEKYQTMALVAVELDAYETLMEGEFYDMALDSLIRGLGRAEKYREDAQTYGCIKELNALELKAETILNETFNLTREEALELYHYRDRRDYSEALNKLLKELGMEKVTE